MWLLVLAPLVAGLLCLRLSDLRQQVALSVVACVAVLVGLEGLWTGNLSTTGVSIALPGIELTLSSNGIGVILAGFTTLLWVASLLFSLGWFKPKDVDNRRYMLLLGATYTGILLTFLAGDFLTLFLGFELMSLASWGLVIHNQTDEAYNAGGLYLFLGVGGGLLILTALAMIYNYTGSFSFAPLPAGAPVEAITLMLLAGFGVKAGMVPVHIWLPEAHPAAPVPASALLSGILIKTGAYGILRTLGLAAEVTEILRTLGATVVMLGIFTMAFGVIMALLQHEAKRMLAFHSISQMGYILTGFGVAAFLGVAGGDGLVGGVYHMLNHSVFKALLFLVAGSVYLYSGHLNLYKLGGLSKLLPFTMAFGLVAAMGITGFPGLNGFASKTIIHHGLLTAVETLPALAWTETIFMIVSAGTVASFIKFIWLIFAGKTKEELPAPQQRPEILPVVAGMALLAVAVIALGVFPNLVSEQVLAPALADMTALGATNFQAHIYSLVSIGDIAIAFVAGAAIYWVGMRWHLFQLSPPSWLSMRHLGGLALSGASHSLENTEKSLGRLTANVERSFHRLEHASEEMLQCMDCKPKSKWDKATSVINLNFDTLLVVGVLSFVLLLYFPLSRLFS